MRKHIALRSAGIALAVSLLSAVVAAPTGAEASPAHATSNTRAALQADSELPAPSNTPVLVEPGKSVTLPVAHSPNPGEGEAVSVTIVATNALPTQVGPVKCASPGAMVYATNPFNNRIWEWTMAVRACWDGRRVTSISPPQFHAKIYKWAQAIGWSYDGIQSQSQDDAFGDKWVYRTIGQGKFSQVYASNHPEITVDIYGNGDGRVWTDRG